MNTNRNYLKSINFKNFINNYIHKNYQQIKNEYIYDIFPEYENNQKILIEKNRQVGSTTFNLIYLFYKLYENPNINIRFLNTHNFYQHNILNILNKNIQIGSGSQIIFGYYGNNCRGYNDDLTIIEEAQYLKNYQDLKYLNGKVIITYTNENFNNNDLIKSFQPKKILYDI